MNQLYFELLEKIKTFVMENSDISCLAQIGSHASNQNDDYSDIDLLLVTKNLDEYFSNEKWLDSIGEKWILFKESVPEANFYERRVIFDHGLDVDFVFVDEFILMNHIEQLPVTKQLCEKNIIVVVDKNNVDQYLEKFKTAGKQFEFPTEEEFDNLVNDFYFHYLWAYKKILRGEYWVALRCINTYLKLRLLTMLEWYEHTQHGMEYNTYYEGRFFERWIDGDLLMEIPELFSSYHPDEMEKSLIRNVEFFTKIARDTAKRNHYSFPEEGSQKLTMWMEKNYIHRMK